MHLEYSDSHQHRELQLNKLNTGWVQLLQSQQGSMQPPPPHRALHNISSSIARHAQLSGATIFLTLMTGAPGRALPPCAFKTPRAAAEHRMRDRAHHEYIYQYVYFHVGGGRAAAPEQDSALRKRHRRLGEAVAEHAAEHGARLCQVIIDRERTPRHFWTTWPMQQSTGGAALAFSVS